MQRGFTLVELAIVLVIIGLIVGGVLVGRDLISAAAVRAQVTQFEKYNAAVNTFRSKYNGLPGDLSASRASEYGFTITACSGTPGKRDGNGLIEEAQSGTATNYHQGFQEVELFWIDLSKSGLIASTFPGGGATDNACNGVVTATLTPGPNYVGDYLPTGAIGNQNFVYVNAWNGFNWYGISTVTAMSNVCMNSGVGLTALQASAIDDKTDDGYPTSGVVQAAYVTCSASIVLAPNLAAPGTNTCYDTTSGKYTKNMGEKLNCALMSRVQ